MKPETLKALHAEWRKLSPNFAVEPLDGETPAQAERRVRIQWSRQALHTKLLDQGKRDIESWKDLKPGEARYLLRKMREESGDGPAWRAQLIARIAVELFGSNWDAMLRERLQQRFHPTPDSPPQPGRGAERGVGILESLTPFEAKQLIEELLSRIARRDNVGIEEARQKFRNRAHEKQNQTRRNDAT